MAKEILKTVTQDVEITQTGERRDRTGNGNDFRALITLIQGSSFANPRKKRLARIVRRMRADADEFSTVEVPQFIVIRATPKNGGTTFIRLHNVDEELFYKWNADVGDYDVETTSLDVSVETRWVLE